MKRDLGVRAGVLALSLVLLCREAVGQAASPDSASASDSAPPAGEPTPWAVMAAALSCARDRGAR